VLELLAPPPVSQADQLARIRFLERDVGLIVRGLALAGLGYFLFLADWLGGLNTIGQLAIGVVRGAFILYTVINVGAGWVYLRMHRLGFDLVRTTTFMLSLIDGVFFGVVTLATGGLESLVFWVFLALMARNAFVFPVASVQVGLNLTLIGSYLLAGYLDRTFARLEQATVGEPTGVPWVSPRSASRRPVTLPPLTNVVEAFTNAAQACADGAAELATARAIFVERCEEASQAAGPAGNRLPELVAPGLHQAHARYTRLFERYRDRFAVYTNLYPHYLHELARAENATARLHEATAQYRQAEAQYVQAADLYSTDNARYWALAARLPRPDRLRPQLESDFTRATYGGQEREGDPQQVLLRILLMLLMTGCCYSLQVSLDRQRLVRHQAEEIQRQKDRLETASHVAAQVAHELRNPLATINNAAFCLERAVGTPPEPIRQQIEIIRDEVDRADLAIRRLLTFSYLAEGPAQRLDLATELDRAIAQVFPPGTDPSLQVEKQVAPDLPPLFMHPADLSEILVNLLRNAREALNGRGRVSIHAKAQPDGSVEVRISDTGPGIPPELLERVFEPYFSTKARGIGLGLAIVRQKTQFYGGSVHAESELGKGATFILKFPGKALMQDRA
jgi:signal transduction histidine kinase